MVYKIKVTITLMVIGLISGVSIWGVNELTAPIIAQNEARAELAMYEAIFPTLTRIEMVEITDHDVLNLEVTIYENDRVIGTVFRGVSQGYGGPVTVLVGIGTDGNIRQVVTGTNSETPNIFGGVVRDLLPRYRDQAANALTLDTISGATQSSQAINRVLLAASIEVAGDARLEAYQRLNSAADTYEDLVALGDAYVSQTEVYDASGAMLMRVFEVDVQGASILLGVREDSVIAGFTLLDPENGPGLSDYDGWVGQPISALEVFNDDSLGTTLETLVRALEGRQFVGGHDFLDYVRELEDGVFEMILHVTGFNRAAQNSFSVQVSDSGLVRIEIINLRDSEGWFNYESTFEALLGLTSVDDLDPADTYAEATATGRSIKNALAAALEYYAERGRE